MPARTKLFPTYALTFSLTLIAQFLMYILRVHNSFGFRYVIMGVVCVDVTDGRRYDQ